MILGANGCGKTTIIECLKYAITGEFPPGSNHGQSFVHDPKIAKSAETLGRVKLRVSNIHGQKIICTRPVKCLRKKNKQLQFSTMQSTIHGVDPETGEEVTTTNRCADVNILMCNAMGILLEIFQFMYVLTLLLKIILIFQEYPKQLLIMLYFVIKKIRVGH